MEINLKRSTICRRCNRGLKDPASIERGLGPICAAKAAAKGENVSTEPTYFASGPVTDIPTVSLAPGVYFIAYPKGGDPRPIATIHAIRLTISETGHPEAHYLDPCLTIDNRSPTGFQYGYGGSGPSQLALAMLHDYLKVFGEDGRFIARAEYQRFKFEFLSRAQPPDLLIVTAKEIEDWLVKEGFAIGKIAGTGEPFISDIGNEAR